MPRPSSCAGPSMASTQLPAGSRQDRSNGMLEAEVVIGDDQALDARPSTSSA